jgi:hypothetical protein
MALALRAGFAVRARSLRAQSLLLRAFVAARDAIHGIS